MRISAIIIKSVMSNLTGDRRGEWVWNSPLNDLTLSRIILFINWNAHESYDISAHLHNFMLYMLYSVWRSPRLWHYQSKIFSLELWGEIKGTEPLNSLNTQT